MDARMKDVAVWGGRFILLVALVFVAFEIRRHWSGISGWRPSASQLTLILSLSVPYALSLLLLAEGWHRIVNLFAAEPRARTFPSFCVTQVAKYLPGNVAHLIGRGEFDYWMDPTTADTIGADRQAFALGAQRRLEAVADRLAFFEDGAEILPGVAAVASHGHTPGHMAFEVRQGANAALIVGDAIGNHHVAFRRPDWESGSDQEMALAVQSRRVLFDRLVNEDMTLVGFHLPDGGIGRAVKDIDGFRFVGEATQ